ncbi:MAG TPA: hypothetical protein VFX97_02070 [Pyrinomonadaceae bacterium]|nr:hypothetical protein [Pyrinomonadaceae bacterium]
MSPNRYNSIALLFAMPLMLFFWQGSSCRSSNANSNGNASMNANTNKAIQSRDLHGTWGGQSIAMEVSNEGAEIEFDCAHGRITEKIAPDADGKFETKGVFARERGGPQRMGENNEQPAIYRGSIKDRDMTLTIQLKRNNEDIGTFKLTQGNSGRIHKCL